MPSRLLGTYTRVIDGHGVVMPLAVAHLRDGPPPLGRLELVERGHLVSLLPQQEHQSTVVYKHGIVVAVFTYRK